MKQTLLILLLLAIVSCDSDKSTNGVADTFVPIDPQELIGRWEGTYALTYNMNTDSTYTTEVDMWIEFSDTTFSFHGDSFGPCGTWGGGSYTVDGKILEFEDHCARTTMCFWENILNGGFGYTYESAVSELRLTQRLDSYLWHVEITKVPKPILY